ncbi:MAG TPA: response regulator [Verrucomicrobiae bacterium]
MKKILIIEDDEIVANIYRSKLTLEGFSVAIAPDGESGLESVRQLRPDVVILDLMLPKLSGVDVLKKVRADPQSEKLPVIVFSNTYLTNTVQDAWKAGATKCLSKASCSPQQFVKVVRATIDGGGPPGGQSVAGAGVQAGATPTPPVKESAGEAAEGKVEFLEMLPPTIAALRMLLQAASRETGAAQLKHVESMHRHAHGLTSKAALGGMWQVAQLSDALEALLGELHEKPANLNVSTLRTVASAVDFLGVLMKRGEVSDKPEELVANILVVDDEPISRRAVIHALEKTKLKAISVDDPQLAFDLLRENQFDLIFLDVDMPGMNGYELCAKVRGLPAYKTTPVVFVTGLSDLEARTNSMMSGGNDFIAKPFIFVELAVKTLVHVLRGQPQAG